MGISKQPIHHFKARLLHAVLTIAAASCSQAAVAQTYDNQTLTDTTTIANGSTATVINNLTLDDAQVDVYGQLHFLGLNTLGGTGRVNLFSTGDLRINAQSSGSSAPQQLTVLSGVEIVGNNLDSFSLPRIAFNSSFGQDTLINYGTIAGEGTGDSANTDLQLSNNNVVNHGAFVARENAVLRLFWRSGWSNLGTIKAEDGGLVNLAGTFNPSDLGARLAEGTGAFSVNATVNNAGNTWTINQNTGSIQLESSTINGGTILGHDGAKLFSVVSGRTLSTLNLNDSVVLDIDMDIQGRFADINVTDGLTVNRDFLFNGDELTFVGNQTLGGMGTLRIMDEMILEGDLTIDSEITVIGESSSGKYRSEQGSLLTNTGTMIDVTNDISSSNNVSLINRGTIRSELRSIRLPDQALNQGLMIASGSRAYIGVNDVIQDGQMRSSNAGRLFITGGTNTLNGRIAAFGGGHVWLSGSITNDGAITVDNGILFWGDPTITGNNVVATNSVVALTEDRASNMMPINGLTRVNTGWGLANGAILDNTGRTLNLTTDRATQWTLYNGAITGGVIDSPDATPLRVQDDGYAFTTSRVTLDSVEVRVPIAIGPDAEVNLFNGAQLLGPIALDRGSILFGDAVTIADLPAITGQGGHVTMVRSFDLAGTVWDIPEAIETLELTSGGPALPSDNPLVVSNGGLSGGPAQMLLVGSPSDNFPAADFILRDIDLQIDTVVKAFYNTLGIEGTVTLQDNTVSVLGGFELHGELIRHGELQVADGASLTGNGTIRFDAGANSSSTIGLLSSLSNELVIDTGITVVGGEAAMGWLGSSGATTRNLGTLVVEDNDSAQPGIRVIGNGLHNEGSIDITLGGWLGIDGDASLGGTLTVDIDTGTTLNQGDTFTLIDIAGTQTGAFSNAGQGDSLGIFDGLALILDYAGGDGNDVVARAAFLGDANLDGEVSLLDLDILGQHYNEVGTWSQGDFNGDGEVSLIDLDLLGQNYGTGAQALSRAQMLAYIGQPVPEPSSLALLGLSGLLLARRRHSA